MIRISGGTGSGQARLIIDYTGSTRVAVVDRDWRTAPDNTSEYELIAAPNLMSTNEGLAQGGGASSITLNASASSIDDSYVGQLVVIRTGVAQDQSRLVTAYNGTTKVATVAQPWVTQPTNASGYMMLPVGRSFVSGFVNDTITADALSAGATGDIADALLNRNINGGGNGTRTVEEALAFLRNKWSLSGTALTVCDTDDSTTLWTATVSTNPSAEPITGTDPA
jgi:hypothetical protein